MVAVSDQVATAEIKLLFCFVLFGNAFRAILASPAAAADAACMADLHPRVLLAHRYLHLTAVPAGALLLAVLAGNRIAEEAAAWAAPNGRAAHEGFGNFAAGWKRRSMRGVLLLALVLSFSASVFADVAFEDGLLYRIGCLAGYGAGAPPALGVLVVGVSAFVHTIFAWEALTQH